MVTDLKESICARHGSHENWSPLLDPRSREYLSALIRVIRGQIKRDFKRNTVYIFSGIKLNAHPTDYVGDFLKEIAPEAKKAGVVFGIEDTISAEDNVRILDRAQSEAVRVYYDVGNSHNNGFDIYKEIRWLGRDRICEIHLKDNPHLMGRGKIDFEKIVRAMADIGFAAWAVLETSAPSGSVEDDMKTNLGFIRQQFARA